MFIVAILCLLLVMATVCVSVCLSVAAVSNNVLVSTKWYAISSINYYLKRYYYKSSRVSLALRSPSVRMMLHTYIRVSNDDDDDDGDDAAAAGEEEEEEAFE